LKGELPLSDEPRAAGPELSAEDLENNCLKHKMLNKSKALKIPKERQQIELQYFVNPLRAHYDR
jgi:hypothetical protein